MFTLPKAKLADDILNHLNQVVFSTTTLWTDLLPIAGYLGTVVQSVVSLTSSLRVISLTVLTDSIYNILIFFAEKM